MLKIKTYAEKYACNLIFLSLSPNEGLCLCSFEHYIRKPDMKYHIDESSLRRFLVSLL